MGLQGGADGAAFQRRVPLCRLAVDRAALADRAHPGDGLAVGGDHELVVVSGHVLRPHGGPRIPGRDSRQAGGALDLVGAGHDPVLLRRLHARGRAGGCDEQDAPDAAYLTRYARWLTIISWLTYPGVYI